MKFCGSQQGDDDVGNSCPADGGGDGTSTGAVFQPQNPRSLMLNIPPSRGPAPTSPPVPGILKARVKHEH